MEGGVRCNPGPEVVFSIRNHFLNIVDGISIPLRLSYDNLKIQQPQDITISDLW